MNQYSHKMKRSATFVCVISFLTLAASTITIIFANHYQDCANQQSLNIYLFIIAAATIARSVILTIYWLYTREYKCRSIIVSWIMILFYASWIVYGMYLCSVHRTDCDGATVLWNITLIVIVITSVMLSIDLIKRVLRICENSINYEIENDNSGYLVQA